MAQRTSESTILQVIECSICFEVMREPKTLQCEHSFCKECLEACVDLDSQKIPLIRCPTCREETSLADVETVNGLKAQLILKQILDGMPEYKKRCEQFNKESKDVEEKLSPRCCASSIEWYCCDCKSYFCKKCFNLHSLLSECGSLVQLDQQDELERFYQVKYCETYGTFTPFCGRHDSYHRHGCIRCISSFCNYCYHEHVNKDSSEECKLVSFKEYGSKFNEPLLNKIALMMNHKEKQKALIDRISQSVDSQKEIIQKHIDERKVVILSQVFFLLQSTGKQILNNFDKELNSYNSVKEKLKDDINSELDLVDNVLNKSENLAKQSLLEIISQTKDLQEEFHSVLTEDVLGRELDFPEMQVEMVNSGIAVNQFDKLFSCVQEIFGNCEIATVKNDGSYEPTIVVCDTDNDNDSIDCRTSMLAKLTDANEAKKYLTKGLKQMNLLTKSDAEKKISEKGKKVASVPNETVVASEEKEDVSKDISPGVSKEERLRLRLMYNENETPEDIPMDETNVVQILCHPHPLRFQHRKKWNCQVCGKQNKASKSYFCGSCKYDACTDCVQMIASTEECANNEDPVTKHDDEQLEISEDLNQLPAQSRHTAYIAGLPLDVTKVDILKFFHIFKIGHIAIFKSKENEKKSALVDFEDLGQYQTALEFDGKQIRSHKIKVCRDNRNRNIKKEDLASDVSDESASESDGQSSNVSTNSKTKKKSKKRSQRKKGNVAAVGENNDSDESTDLVDQLDNCDIESGDEPEDDSENKSTSIGQGQRGNNKRGGRGGRRGIGANRGHADKGVGNRAQGEQQRGSQASQRGTRGKQRGMRGQQSGVRGQQRGVRGQYRGNQQGSHRGAGLMNSPMPYQHPVSASSLPSLTMCYKCGVIGHVVSECPTMQH